MRKYLSGIAAASVMSLAQCSAQQYVIVAPAPTYYLVPVYWYQPAPPPQPTLTKVPGFNAYVNIEVRLHTPAPEKRPVTRVTHKDEKLQSQLSDLDTRIRDLETLRIQTRMRLLEAQVFKPTPLPDDQPPVPPYKRYR